MNSMVIKRIIKISTYLLAAFVLVTVNAIITEGEWQDVQNTRKLVYGILLLCCFAYLHQGLHSYLLPISRIPSEQHPQIRRAISAGYSKSFFASTVLAGYFCLLMVVVPLFEYRPSLKEHNYLLAAVLFVILGTASKAHALSLYLIGSTHDKPAQPTPKNGAAGL
ncbi:MAG: hypothetical protein H6974_12230 [Gammaproteobacteria bacterium]|nr:hypothetical protein [Gammaproteobacteria bacterium]